MTSYVYAMTDGKQIKLGKSNNIMQRLKTLRCANPGIELLAEIECPDATTAHRVEHAIHNYFGDQRQMLEWFSVDKESVLRIFRLLKECLLPAPEKEATFRPALPEGNTKARLIYDWFSSHPADLLKPSRELESIELPFGVTATYRTWNHIRNKFKQEVESGNFPR